MKNVPHQLYNEMQSHHVPQCLSEMVAYDAKELWLVCYTLYAVSIICVQFDEHLWNKIMVIVEDLYGGGESEKSFTFTSLDKRA